MNKLTFIIILFVVIIIYFVSIDNIHFLNKKETINLFESLEYFKYFDENNMVARNLSKNIKIKDYYKENTLNFTKYDKKIIRDVINKLNLLSNNFILFREWKFSLVTYNVEKGLPHTHKDVIILSKNLVSSLSINDGMFLFIHEKTHILQRKYNELFIDLYQKWNFIKVKNILNLEKYQKLSRLNPDGIDINWIFKLKKTYVLPLAMYKEDNINLVNCENMAIYLKFDGSNYIIPDNPKIKSLSDCDEYNTFFDGINSNNYHPNELAAEYMSIYWMKKLGFKNNTDNLGEKIFTNWYNKNKLKLI